MRRYGNRFLLVTVTLVLILLAIGNLAAAKRVLIGLKDKDDRGAWVAAMGGRVLGTYEQVGVLVADIPDDKLTDVKGKQGVQFAEDDAITRKLGGDTVPWGVDRIGAPHVWPLTRGQGVKVAILDTGIDATHYDLHLAGGYTAVGIDSDYDVDLDGHGTHVAGTVAALDNGSGVVGVAPAVSLYSVKVLDDTGVGTVSALVDGINWCIRNKVKILNMSMGTTANSQALKKAVEAAEEAGLLLIAAAGNGGNVKGSGNTVQYPATYKSVIAVGAVDETDVRASFSATGSKLDLVAPGVNISSTFPDNRIARAPGGTSFAAPHVTGTAALVWALNPSWTHSDVRNRLFSTAVRVGNGDKKEYGHGRVDAAAAAGVMKTAPASNEALAVQIVVTPETVKVGDTATVTVRVTSQQKPVAGAVVALTVTCPNGSSFTTNGYTAADGSAVFHMRTHKKYGSGFYHLRAKASKSGYSEAVQTLNQAFRAQ